MDVEIWSAWGASQLLPDLARAAIMVSLKILLGNPDPHQHPCMSLQSSAGTLCNLHGKPRQLNSYLA